MGAPDGITAQLQNNIQLLMHQLRRESKAPFRMLLMPVHTLQIDRGAVDQNPVVFGLYSAEADPLDFVVMRCPQLERI
ncbi:hypothetical protein D3C75_476130 [compost metagenome]